jgi:hypothetical protein
LKLGLLDRSRVIARRSDRLKAASRALLLKPSRPNAARVCPTRRLTLKVAATDPAGGRDTATQALALRG